MGEELVVPTFQALRRPNRHPSTLALLDGDYEGHLLGTSAPCLALGADIGIIKLDSTAHHIRYHLQCHGCPYALQEVSGTLMGDLELVCQLKSGISPLVMRDEGDGQKPLAKRQMAAMHHRMCRQRGLMPTVMALELAPVPYILP